jgi:hypothetical protein
MKLSEITAMKCLKLVVTISQKDSFKVLSSFHSFIPYYRHHIHNGRTRRSEISALSSQRTIMLIMRLGVTRTSWFLILRMFSMPVCEFTVQYNLHHFFHTMFQSISSYTISPF